MFNLFRAVFGRNQSSEAVSKSITAPIELSRADGSTTVAPLEENKPALCRPRDEFLDLPLRAILSRFPEKLQMQVRWTFGRMATIPLPVSEVLEQLKRGAVRLSFKQIKALAPQDTFLMTTAHDDVVVDLPLSEILARLQAEHLTRRPGQRRVSVPDETPQIFCPTGSVRGTDQTAASAAVNRASTLAAEPTPEQSDEPPLVAFPFEQRIGFAERLSPPQPTRTPLSGEGTQGLNGRASVLTVALERVVSRWPELLRGAVERLATDDTVLQIPIDEIEPGIKRGRLAFAWKQIRPWMVPPLACPLDEYDAEQIELPLAEVAPIFMARRRQTETRTASISPVDIPDLFSTDPRKPVGGEADLTQITHSSVATVIFPPSGDPANPRPPRTISESVTLSARTDAGGECAKKSCWTEPAPCEPAGIVEHACRLPGVSGALIATEDGLVVAAQLPSDLAPDSLAAFVPRMHQRTMQDTTEMGFGEPSQLTLVVRDRPLMILRINCGYFVTVGSPKEALPELQLKELAGGLIQPVPNG